MELPTLNKYSFIIPVYNEEDSIKKVIDEINSLDLAEKEIIVVDDHSTDESVKVCRNLDNVKIIQNLMNFGYGYSLKAGIKHAQNDHVVIIDGDGSYPLKNFNEMKENYEKGFDMVIGRRIGKNLNKTLIKAMLRSILKFIVEFSVGNKIPDINSGFRIFNRKDVIKYFDQLCDTFSFSTSITLIYHFNKKSIKYIDIDYSKRIGNSKVKMFRDSLRTMQYISELLLYFNPIKMFLAISIIFLIAFLSSVILSFVTILSFNFAYIFLFFSIFSIIIGFVAQGLK
jgi:glycosyltransferase involved in cell wall biosynthesis